LLLLSHLEKWRIFVDNFILEQARVAEEIYQTLLLTNRKLGNIEQKQVINAKAYLVSHKPK